MSQIEGMRPKKRFTQAAVRLGEFDARRINQEQPVRSRLKLEEKASDDGSAYNQESALYPTKHHVACECPSSERICEKYFRQIHDLG